MSLSNKVILSFAGCTLMALIAWVLIDFNGFYRLEGHVQRAPIASQLFVTALFGIFVGTALGIVRGLSTGSSPQLRREVIWGAGAGLIGGFFGLLFGQLAFGALYISSFTRQGVPFVSPLIFLWNVFVRAIGWALIGLFIGLAQGLPSGSKKAARHGAVGGLIGGFLGGMLFEIVPHALVQVYPDLMNPSVISRGISMTVTGASIGLFVGLVENLMKQAWVRVASGRNEGKEFIISKPRTTLGRDELSDIGLFGDHTISPLHAVIETLPGGRHVIKDAGTQIGTSVNSNRISEHMLRDGETIHIGSLRLEFYEKATASRLPSHADVSPTPPPSIPENQGVCPFCGGRKDPGTGSCACTVAGQAVDQGPQWGQLTTAQSPNPVPSGAGPRLTGIEGPYAGHVFTISTAEPTRIGREDGRDIRLPLDTTVSRRHGYIAVEGNGFIVYDEGSSNGTTVNGMRINRQPLASGDVVAFGSSAFRFEES